MPSIHTLVDVWYYIHVAFKQASVNIDEYGGGRSSGDEEQVHMYIQI